MLLFVYIQRRNRYMSSIESCVLKLGVDPSVSGYKKLTEAVRIYLSTDEKVTLKTICKTIGSKHSLSDKAVFREIDYALKKAKNIDTNLEKLTGIKIYEEDIRPKYVISLVVEYMKQETEENGFLTQIM